MAWTVKKEWHVKELFLGSSRSIWVTEGERADRKAPSVLQRRRSADFEAPASIRIARVRCSPVEPKEHRFSIEKVAAAHALFSALRGGRTAPLNISDARLVDRTLRGRQYHVVGIADGLEDVDAANTRLTRNVHGPIWQLGAENDHLRNARICRRLLPFENAQRA